MQFVTFVALTLTVVCGAAHAVDIYDLYGHGPALKRMLQAAMAKRGSDGPGCAPISPFSCPGGSKVCLPLQYICDGEADCPDSYDEDSKLCTAAVRPPVEETVNFLNHLLQQNGADFLVNLFGEGAKNKLAPLGGVEAVAVALSQSKTIEDFSNVLHLMAPDKDHLRTILEAIENDEPGVLRSLGIKDSAVGDLKFFLDKLVKTGFLTR